MSTKMIIKTPKNENRNVEYRNIEMKSNDVKQHLKNYKLMKRCSLNRLIAS